MPILPPDFGGGGGGTTQDIIIETSTNYAVQIVDDVVIGTGTINITLPLASNAVRRITIVAEAASTLTILLSGSDTLSGAITNPVTFPSSVTLVATPSNEWVGV